MARSTALVVVHDRSKGAQYGPRYDSNRLSMPELVKAALDQAAKIGVAKLANLLQSKEFDALPPEKQIHLINMVLTRAYGAPAAPPREVAPKPQDAASVRLTETLRSLAERAQFPEMKQVDPTTIEQTDSTPKEG